MNNQTIKNMRNRTVRLEREGDYWKDDEKGQLVSLFHEGIGLSEIAVILQRTEPAIIQQVEKMDLYQRKAAPIRKKSSFKQPRCLCSDCSLDPALCPMNSRDVSIEEDL